MPISLPSAFPTLLALALATSCSGGDTDAARRPNVLLITLDTTRADRFSCYGYPEQTTPNFDALAADGVRFALGVTTAAVTPVSHAAILTGRFNHEHGLRVMSADYPDCVQLFRLADDVPSLFPVLKENGWTTAAVQSAFPVSEWFGFDRGFDVFESLSGTMNTGGPRHQWDIRVKQRRSDQTTDIALSFLEGADGPWALWIHYWDPHDTVFLPPSLEMPADLADRSLEERKAWSRSTYERELAYVDQQFGRLVDALREMGVWEDTLVAVVSDHGEGLDDHAWWYHRILYQEQIHAPYLMRLPGVELGTSGAVIEPLVRTIDVAPTLLDALGLPPLAGASGRSLLPLVAGRDDVPRVAFADQINGYDKNTGDDLLKFRPQDTWVYCVMDRRWKLLYRPAVPGASELFDLLQDPGELANLFSFDHPEARRLLQELARERPWMVEPCEGAAGSENPAAGTLEDIGYAGNDLVAVDWHWTSVTERGWFSDTWRKDPAGESPILIHR